MFVHDMKKQGLYGPQLSVKKSSLEHDTNRDKGCLFWAGRRRCPPSRFFVNEPEPYVTSVPAPGEPERNIARWLCE